MAVVTISNAFDPNVWLPDYLAFDPQTGDYAVSGTATTTTLTAVTVLGLMEFTSTGVGYAFGTGDLGGPVAGVVQSLTISVNGDVWLTMTGLEFELTDLNRYVFGWERRGVWRPGDGFDLMSLLLSGADTINGSNNGDDLIPGRNPGNDVINAGLGDDFIKADAGNDTIDGGEGRDTYALDESFFDASAYRGAVVNLATGVATDSWGGTDSLSGIEQVRGSRLSDRLIGGDGNEQFMGLSGRDTINGGAGEDMVRYDRDADYGGTQGVVVNLALGTATDGWGHTDVLRGIEGVRGTAGNDTLIGDGNSNWFVGGDGVDSINGGAGLDWAEFWGDNQTSGVVVDLSRANGQVRNDGWGNVETLRGIENLWGSGQNDRLTGNTGANFLGGDHGDDTLSGGGGDDTLQGGIGADLLTGGDGVDTFVFRAQSDEFPWGDTITDFVSGVDRLAFDTATFEGMAGAQFRVGNAAGTAGEGWFYFNNVTDRLFWDADGRGGNAAVLVATLTGVNVLTLADFDLY